MNRMREVISLKVFFIGLRDKLLIIKETNDGYAATAHLLETRTNRLAFDPANEDRIYAATFGEGLWKTENRGENWERIGLPDMVTPGSEQTGIYSSKVTSVAVSPKRIINGNHVVYAGTEPSMLYYSEDLGENWIEFKGIQDMPSKQFWSFPPRPHTHFVRWITPSYSDKDHLAISIEAGAVLHTNNHGMLWHDRPEISPIDTHTLLAHPSVPNKLYAANGDGSWGSREGHSYAESDDGGETWQFKSEGLESHPYLYNMVLNSENPNDRLVSASRSAAKAHRSPAYSTVYRKIDDEQWTEIASGLPREGAFTHHLAEDPAESGAYYALNNFGIFYLSAGADEWERLPIDSEEFGFAERPFCFIAKEYET